MAVNPLSCTRAGQGSLVTAGRSPIGVGVDVAGVVETVGDDVTDLAVGQRVWGLLPAPAVLAPMGTAAEFVVFDAARLGTIPAGLDASGAVAVLVGGSTAVTALFVHGRLRAGQRVLVRGAAGGVGYVARRAGRRPSGRCHNLAAAADCRGPPGHGSRRRVGEARRGGGLSRPSNPLLNIMSIIGVSLRSYQASRPGFRCAPRPRSRWFMRFPARCRCPWCGLILTIPIVSTLSRQKAMRCCASESRARSAEAFEIACGAREFSGHPAEFVGFGAVFGRGDDVFGGAPQLEELVQQRGDLVVGQHDRVFGKTGALERASPFVGALTARLAAVLPPPPYRCPLLQLATTPSTVRDATPPHPGPWPHQNVT